MDSYPLFAPRQHHSPTSVEIIASDGMVVLVDENDLEAVSKIHWWTTPGRNTRYAGGKVSGKKVLMHRLITNAPSGSFVDHKNGNGLDNRRANLRICGHLENNRNAGKRADGVTSTFRGVSWHKSGKAFVAQISVNKRKIYLGLFKSERRAAAEYDSAALYYHGEFASLNFGGQVPLDVLAEVRGELVAAGEVVESGETRKTKSGRNATVWRLA